MKKRFLIPKGEKLSPEAEREGDASEIGTLDHEKAMDKMAQLAATRSFEIDVPVATGQRTNRPNISPSEMNSGTEDESLEAIDQGLEALRESILREDGGITGARARFFQTKKRKDHDVYLNALRGKGLDPEARARSIIAPAAAAAKHAGGDVTVTTSSPHGASFFNHGAGAMCRWEDDNGWGSVKVTTLTLLDPNYLRGAGAVETHGSDAAHKKQAASFASKIKKS